MSATTSAALVLAAMVAAHLAARALKASAELALFAAALAGGLAGGQGIPARHIVEGAFTYFDIVLIFITATLFMNILKASGAAAFVVRAVLRRFHRRKAVFLALLALLLLVPGALTGAGSVTVLILGGMAATILGRMGLPPQRTAAIIFIIAGLSAAAPPVSLWAMLTAAGVNMPYVGFFLPLFVPCVLLGLATAFLLGRKARPVDLAKALEELPEAPARMTGLRVGVPFLVLFAIIAAGRAFPFALPVIGLPLTFAAAAGAALILSPVRIGLFKTAGETVAQLLPLIGTLTAAGILVQIMALTGVRGLIAITTVTLPVVAVWLTLFVTLPVSEAVLMWGAAPVIGVPLVLLFNTIGLDPVVSLAGMSVIWPLGDAFPPTAVIGRLTTATVGLTGSYGEFLKEVLPPAIVVAIAGTLMVVFSKTLSFLTVF